MDFKDRNLDAMLSYILGIDCVKIIIYRDFTFYKYKLHLYATF